MSYAKENISFSEELFAQFDQHFEENFATRGDLGAAVSIWHDGQEIWHAERGPIHRQDGSPSWQRNTLIPVWSATKGPASSALLLAWYRAGLDLDTPVSQIWPEFGRAGKSALTLGQVMSHQGGLSALDTKVPLNDRAALEEAFVSQAPRWEPGQSGYHARTFGFLLELIFQKLTGRSSIGQWFQYEIAQPAGIDFWIGLPESEFSRLARIQAPKMKTGSNAATAAPEDQKKFYQAWLNPDTLTGGTFRSPVGLHAVAEINAPEHLAAGYASFGGCASAHGLAAFYALLSNRKRPGAWLSQGTEKEIFPAEVIEWMRLTQVSGEDLVLLQPMAFSAGFMKDPRSPKDGQRLRRMFGVSESSFGHPGAGGSHAWADPETGLSFAYVMNQMELGVLPNEKSIGFARILQQFYAHG